MSAKDEILHLNQMRCERLKRAETEQNRESNPEELQTVFEQQKKQNKKTPFGLWKKCGVSFILVIN